MTYNAIDQSGRLSDSTGTVGDASVYHRESFKAVDIGAQMRLGHIDIAEGDDYIVSLVRASLKNRTTAATIVDIGSGSGVLSEYLASQFPEHKVVANDNARSNSEKANTRLACYPNASVFDAAFEYWVEPADVFISWGSHHHLPHDYIKRVHELLRPGGRFIVADEFCPEYLSEAELSGGRAWLIDGYLYTSAAEEKMFRETGTPPQSVLDREEARRNALWKWYRYVIDKAVERNDWTVAVIELQIARDDLTTGFADEHKTSPLVLETELKDAGFAILSRRHIGERKPALQSFVVYESVRSEELKE